METPSRATRITQFCAWLSRMPAMSITSKKLGVEAKVLA